MKSKLLFFIKKQIQVSIFLICCMFFCQTIVSYTPNLTNSEINSSLTGSNIVITGGLLNFGDRSTQIAKFTNGINAGLEMEDGTFFGTGTAAKLLTTNIETVSTDLITTLLYGDPDLLGIDSNTQYDVVSYEFSVTLGPKATILDISYQFGSEEYPDYVRTNFNDSFGFFISGPGITGTTNLAKLPNNNDTSINTINFGVPGFFSDLSIPIPGYDDMQSSLYLRNGHTTTLSGGKLIHNLPSQQLGPFPIAVEFNGITKLITYSLSALTPGATYTFKIAIGDSFDGYLDSGVFINKIFATAKLGANNDAFTVKSGSTTSNSVLDNDDVNDISPANILDVVLSQVSTTHPSINLNPTTGLIEVAPGTPAGVYTVVYQICDMTFLSNCKSATAIITVEINDRDGDGIDNSLDLDNDNDGILDNIECSTFVATSYSGFNTGLATDGVRSTTLTITPDLANTSGYAGSGVPTYLNANNTLRITYPGSALTSSDRYSFNVDTSNSTPGYQTQIRLYQINNNAATTGNNEASTYTITWTGGQGNAKFYDPETPSISTDYRYGVPASFDLNNGQIEGLNTSGEILNGGSFVVYNINNSVANWYVDFPIGASNIKITKVVMNGAKVFVPSTDINLQNPAAGRDGNYPNYGGISGVNAGESFTEFNAIQVLFILDTDGDGIQDCLDPDSDGDGCPDAVEGSEAVKSYQVNSLSHPFYPGQINVLYDGVTTGIPSGVISTSAAANGVPQLVNNAGSNLNASTNPSNLAGVADNTDGTADVGQGIGDSPDNTLSSCKCYKLPSTDSNTYPTRLGITAFNRAGVDNENWPMVRQSGWIALEASTKGFVINRMPASTTGGNTGEPVDGSGTAVITSPIAGMMFYDTTNDCLKINVDGTRSGWKCFNNQSCPDEN